MDGVRSVSEDRLIVSIAAEGPSVRDNTALINTRGNEIAREGERERVCQPLSDWDLLIRGEASLIRRQYDRRSD